MRFHTLVGLWLTLSACQLQAHPDRLSADQIGLRVDPANGGRISSLSFHGRELLWPASERDRANWGSTLWISPQASWGWPPPDSFDNLAYELGPGLRLQGPVDAQKTGLAIGKQVTYLGDNRLQLNYRLSNPGPDARAGAAWEVTRVASTGLILFAHESAPWWGFGDFPFQSHRGIAWIDLRASELSEGKLNANGRGWLVWISQGDVLIKRFGDLQPGQPAPGEDELSVYISPRGYLELEAQGPLAQLAPGQQAQFGSQWWLLKLPAAVQAEVNSASLLQWLAGLGLPLE